MKKLQRYRLDATQSPERQSWDLLPVPHDKGEWIKHDEAMQARAEQQAVFDRVNRQRERLLTCVEVADRMRAFMEDFVARVKRGDPEPDYTEAELCVALYAETRKLTMGPENV